MSRRPRPTGPRPSARAPDYRALRHPFAPQPVFSTDHVQALHAAALGVLEAHGIKVLLPQAVALFRAAGARVDGEMVRIGREIAAHALALAPARIPCIAGAPGRDLVLEPGALAFLAGSGAPNAGDARRGRRPGSQADFESALKLVQGFDALHAIGPFIESQDIPPPLRHLAVTRAQLVLSDKLPFVYARGTAQTEDALAMIALARGLSDDALRGAVHCYTVINSNSPRQLDIPMSQGIIDFARAGQVSVITPFCLMGAMAPISVAGALVLQHAEALAGITLAQLARPGAPVLYGSFSSNVDMKSGAPAFGTPAHIQATLGAGQLARHLGLPWRSGAGSAGNAPDAQGAQENLMGLWASMLAGATMVIHAAGWLEGGLTFGFEKFLIDMEAVQTLAELCTPPDGADLALDAIAEVAPGGHFFATGHTMARYDTAFYEPLLADLRNHGQWSEAGAPLTQERAASLCEARLAAWQPLPQGSAIEAALAPFVERRTREGGAPPVS